MDRLDIVDSISATATVLVALNDRNPLMILENGFAAPPPRLRRSASSSAMRDGSVPVSAVYEDREITVRLDVAPGSRAGAVSVSQVLARQLGRPAWLRWQPDGLEPIFFRTRAVDWNSIDERNGRADGARRIDLSIPADPFAYGLLETGSQSVSHNPVGSTNPMGFTLPTVKGDVPAPLRVQTHVIEPAEDSGPGVGVGNPVYACLIGSSRASTVVQVQPVPQAATLWVTQTIEAAQFVGGSSRGWFRQVGGSTPNATTLIAHAALPAVPRGEYRLLLRAYRDEGLGAVSVRARVADTASTTPPKPLAAGPRWIDLGVVRLPGRAPAASIFGPDLPASATSTVELTFTVPTPVPAESPLMLDSLLLFPAPGGDGEDGRVARASNPLGGANAVHRLVFGGPDEIIGDGLASGALPTSNHWTVEGGVLTAVPGQANRINLMPFIYPAYDYDIGRSSNVAWGYYPRYLYLRPAGS